MSDFSSNLEKVQSLQIVVLLGGPSSEHEVSLATGRAVAKALREAGLERVQELVLSSEEVELPAGTDLAFNCLHGTFGEDGQLQAKLAALGIPLTGAKEASSRLAFDKLASKEVFQQHGVPTPRFVVLEPDQLPAESPLGIPVVVKPTREGSSVGVHIVKEAAQWAEAAAQTAAHGCPVLVEEFVQGRELTVGILDAEALPVVEIIPRNGFYDMANKYPWMKKSQQGEAQEESAEPTEETESEEPVEPAVDYVCPAELSEAERELVQKVAVEAHKALGIESYSRVDVLLDEAGQAWVLEANTIPGMTETSLLPKAAAAAGIAFPELCLRIAALGLA